MTEVKIENYGCWWRAFEGEYWFPISKKFSLKQAKSIGNQVVEESRKLRDADKNKYVPVKVGGQEFLVHINSKMGEVRQPMKDYNTSIKTLYEKLISTLATFSEG